MDSDRDPIKVPHAGRCRRLTVFGVVTDDGRHFRTSTYGFNNKTLILYVKAFPRRFKKSGADTGQGIYTSFETGKERIWQKQKHRVNLLAHVSPHLSASKQRWNWGERDMLNSKYSEIFGGMRRAVSTCLRMIRFGLYTHKHLNRDTSKYV